MFGIDLGISVSSVTCVTLKNTVLDYNIIFGDKQERDEWKRIREMSDAIVNAINEICIGYPGMIIESMVSIEEPVYPYRTRNPRSYFNMCCLYALTRNKLAKRDFTIYSINPVSAKATAKHMAFGNTKLKEIHAVRGRLTKKGMIRAFKKVTGKEPNYSNLVGKETLADSFFIALAGLERRKVGVK